MKGKNDATTFLPKTDKKGGTFTKVVKTNNPNDILIEEQVKLVYKRVNAGKGINTSIIKQEIVQTKLVELDYTYQNAILTDIDKKRDPTQMEEWSILSEHVRYITHDESEAFHRLNIDSLNYRQKTCIKS